jgi:capsular polysaccharide biosynthesis protein/Mrp family chromosome partitioning ATPase
MRNVEPVPRDSTEPEFPLTLGYYLGLLARRWWIPVSLAVLCACLSLGYTGLQDVRYEARATILLSPLDPETADELSSLTPTVARLIRSDSVLIAAERAYRRTAGPAAESRTPAEVRERTAVRVPRDTSLFEVAAEGPTQRDANALVRAIVQAATDQVSSLAQRRAVRTEGPRLSFAGFGPPVAQGKVSPTPTRNLVVGTNVGLLLGIVGALLLRDPRRSRMRADQLAQLLRASDVVYAPLPSPRLLLNRPHSAISLHGSASEPLADRNAEGIRLLGGRLWQWLQRDRHVVLLAGDLSPKSLRFVALKLAAHLARTGIRPLVLEADYHGGPWETGSRDRGGLGNLLAAKNWKGGPEPIAVETSSQNGDGPGSFGVLPRGTTPGEPALEFASGRYRSLLKRFVSQHELVLVVGPPSEWQAELLALAECSDGIVLLVPAWVAHSRATALATLRSLDHEASVVVSVFGDAEEMPLATAREV